MANLRSTAPVAALRAFQRTENYRKMARPDMPVDARLRDGIFARAIEVWAKLSGQDQDSQDQDNQDQDSQGQDSQVQDSQVQDS